MKKEEEEARGKIRGKRNKKKRSLSVLLFEK